MPRLPGDPLLRAGIVGLGMAFLIGVGVLAYGLFSLQGGMEEAGTIAYENEEETTFDAFRVLDEPGPGGIEEGGPSTVTPPGDAPEPAGEAGVQRKPQPKPQTVSGLEPTTASAARSPLPGEPQNWPDADADEVAAADGERDYGPIPRSAILGLTIDAIGIKNAPVLPDDGPAYLDRGVTHTPETSLPWSGTPERNTYLAAHRIGYPATGSRLLFYNLNQLSEGDEIVLARRTGKKYTYRVTEMFLVDPTDSWVMGRVRGRDMVTLQTCAPIPTFEKRLIVRADRV